MFACLLAWCSGEGKEKVKRAGKREEFNLFTIYNNLRIVADFR